MDNKKDVGQLGGPGSEIEPGLNVVSQPSLLGMLKAEDAKAARANANLQERLSDVANMDESLQGGFSDHDDTDTADQQE